MSHVKLSHTDATSQLWWNYRLHSCLTRFLSWKNSCPLVVIYILCPLTRNNRTYCRQVHRQLSWLSYTCASICLSLFCMLQRKWTNQWNIFDNVSNTFKILMNPFFPESFTNVSFLYFMYFLLKSLLDLQKANYFILSLMLAILAFCKANDTLIKLKYTT